MSSKYRRAFSKPSYIIFTCCSNLSSDIAERGEKFLSWVSEDVIKIEAFSVEEMEI